MEKNTDIAIDVSAMQATIARSLQYTLAVVGTFEQLARIRVGVANQSDARRRERENNHRGSALPLTELRG